MRTIAKSRTLLFWDMITPLLYRIGFCLYSIPNFQIMDLDNGQSVCFAVRNRFRYFKIDFHRGDKRPREAAHRKHLSVRFLLSTHPRTDAIGLFFSIAYLREQFTLENSFAISIWIYLSCCAYLLEARIKTVLPLSLFFPFLVHHDASLSDASSSSALRSSAACCSFIPLDASQHAHLHPLLPQTHLAGLPPLLLRSFSPFASFL